MPLRNKCSHSLRSCSLRCLILNGSFLPTFMMQGNLGEKTALPFRWVTAGKTQRHHKGKLCSDLAIEWTGCTHIPEIHTSHSTHSSYLSTALWMPKQKMNLQKPVQPAQNLQPPKLQSFCCEWKQCCLWRAPFSLIARLPSSLMGRT